MYFKIQGTQEASPHASVHGAVARSLGSRDLARARWGLAVLCPVNVER